MKNNLELKVFRGWAGLLVVLAGLCILPSRSFGLALLNDTANLWPNQELANLNNNVVRVSESYGATQATSSTYVGTGTIISVVPDGNGGDYYNVLTADHVVYGADNSALGGNYGSISIGFNSSPGQYSGATYPLSVGNIAKNVQLDGANNGPDLAVFSVDVSAAQLAAASGGPASIASPNSTFANVSLVQNVSLLAPNNSPGNNQIVQAGYGNQATTAVAPPPGAPVPAGTSVYKSSGDYGTFNAGYNTIPANGNRADDGAPFGLVAGYVGVANGRGGNYTYDAIRGGFNISGTTWTSYVLSGDSGGPTFQYVDGFYDLVGVHSSSETYGSTYVTPFSDSLWSDVAMNSTYISWIDGASIAVDVPEPSALALTGMGGLFWLLRHGRRVGRS